jgi:hypothetical protein
MNGLLCIGHGRKQINIVYKTRILLGSEMSNFILDNVSDTVHSITYLNLMLPMSNQIHFQVIEPVFGNFKGERLL